MKGATSIQERLWELRKDKGLNLEELSELTGISKSALGSYEKEDYKEINHGNLITLADFYGVSVDYLLCRTENREQINIPLTELHLNDEMVALLKSGRINNRLLCELTTHKDFIKFLADIEIYVDGIATMQIQNLNALVDTVRQEQPNTKGGFIVTSNTYNDKGQPVRSQTEDMASTVTVYNELGHAVRRTVQLDDLHPDDPSRNRVSENSSCYRLREDGVYQVQTSTTCNADGFPLTQTTENMVSRLSAVLENKSITTDVYGQQSIQWTEYTAPTKRTRFSRIPTSDIIAESLVVDGFTVSQTDHSGICSIQRRSCTSTGVILEKTDGRGNTIMEETDLAGRPVKTTGPAGHVTTTSYSSCCDHPACITDALGGTTCYSYDIRGRKTAEYGTVIQPACFAYDEADRMVALTTFRANEGDITSDPSGQTDGDTTIWLYDEATGLELKKTYADGSCVSKTYDELNRQETLVKARGLVTTYKYAPFTGELVSASHNDATPGWKFTYNHLGQMTSIRDASGIRECSYDAYGRMIQDTSFGQVESSLQEEYDAQGRSNGYRLMLGTRTVQHSHLDYDSKGGMIGMNLEGLKSSFTWRYDQTTGFLHHLTYPNGMVRQNTYHPTLNIVTAIGYRKEADGELAVSHEYDYDALMRPVQRRDCWDSTTAEVVRDFTYNSRSELLEDRISRGGCFSYQYDNIGNRKTARELEEDLSYESNRLNQYTDIAGGKEDFTPVYDADGNQTRIRTSTGIWEVSYDANDRPVVFTSQDGRTSITCGYDYRGRRFEKKVVINGAVSSHSRFLYRDYLQVAELDLMQPEPMLIKSYLLDPTEPTATRILMMTCWQENGIKVKEHLYFMHDALKNVTSIFDGQQTRRARYEYAPFGSLLTAKEDMAQENKFRFSCEYADDELGLVYYNYRHLNPTDGRWINRDPIQEQGGWNLYSFINNSINIEADLLGLSSIEWELGDVKEIVTKKYNLSFSDPGHDEIIDNFIINGLGPNGRAVFAAVMGFVSLRYWNIDIMKIYTHFLAGRGTDYTYDPNKIPKKPEMYAVRKAIAFVKADPKNRCNKNIRMKNWSLAHSKENDMLYILGDYSYIVGGIVDNKFNFKYSLYIYDIYDFDFRSLEGTWKEKMAKCFRNVACFVSGKIPEFQFNSKNFIIKGVKQDEYNPSSNK